MHLDRLVAIVDVTALQLLLDARERAAERDQGIDPTEGQLGRRVPLPSPIGDVKGLR